LQVVQVLHIKASFRATLGAARISAQKVSGR
jgi:hypothetical protein